MAKASSGVNTGWTYVAPFAMANVIVVVARKMSMTTTLLPSRHVNGNKSGEKMTSRDLIIG